MDDKIKIIPPFDEDSVLHIERALNSRRGRFAETNLLARPRLRKGNAPDGFETMPREQIGEIVNTPPPKARVMVGRIFLRFTPNGLNYQHTVALKHSPDFSKQLFSIEGVVE